MVATIFVRRSPAGAAAMDSMVRHAATQTWLPGREAR
jgi:hypothetical protein